MSRVKKMWIAVVILVSVAFIMAVVSYNRAYEKELKANKPVKKMIMKCGAGKCGAAMMDDMDKESKK